PLTVNELERAQMIIIRDIQTHSFSQEIADLKNRQCVKHNSALLTLHPFLDQDGIIRVGGRLANAQLEYEQRHPIVLPAHNHVTRIIIRDEHLRNLHLGPQALLATLQESFWIISAKSAIRQVLHKCTVCFRARPRHVRQIMGDLPVSRVMGTRAFVNVGIDYGGPFNIKLSRNKTGKAYICVFVCMATKAIHIELVSDLSTAAFLNALKRFIARRGLCTHIHSDNGSNFKGASRELQEFFKLIRTASHQETIHNYCMKQAIQWHFIPPYSPHMGGIWEAGIKSVKTHLRKILGEALLSFEEMYTILTQIEAVLNSRPLTPLSTDPTDLQALTPGHFLIGAPLNAIPQCSLTEMPNNRLNRFQYLTKLVQSFWSRWSREYLSTLQKRIKWNREDQVSTIKNGMMVILQEDNLPSMQWPLGRIVECHPGHDKHIRIVNVKTAKGVLSRPVTRLCILPIE
ncbi:Pro-Pol polyprotein, partial [Cyphomyrmex costatus]